MRLPSRPVGMRVVSVAPSGGIIANGFSVSTAILAVVFVVRGDSHAPFRQWTLVASGDIYRLVTPVASMIKAGRLDGYQGSG